MAKENKMPAEKVLFDDAVTVLVLDKTPNAEGVVVPSVISKEVAYKGEFLPAENLQEAMARLGGDEKRILEAINSELQKDAENAAIAAALNGVPRLNKSQLLKAIAPMRDILFANITERKEQTAAALNWFASMPQLIEPFIVK